MRALAYDASAYNASICECAHSHRMRTHFSCVMRAFAYVVWASSVSVMRAYARIRMRCERIRIACARIRIACARIACECAHLRGTYACPVLYVYIYIYNSAGLRPYALTQSGNQQSQQDHTAWNSMFQLACKWKIKDQCIWSSHFFADTNVINRLQQGVWGVGHPVVALDMACDMAYGIILSITLHCMLHK